MPQNAGFLLELPHHVVFADVEMPGQCINGQIAVQMFIDVLKDLDDLGIAIVRINEFQMVFCSSAVQMDHKFQKQYLPVQFCMEQYEKKGYLNSDFRIFHLTDQLVK